MSNLSFIYYCNSYLNNWYCDNKKFIKTKPSELICYDDL